MLELSLLRIQSVATYRVLRKQKAIHLMRKEVIGELTEQ